MKCTDESMALEKCTDDDVEYLRGRCLSTLRPLIFDMAIQKGKRIGRFSIFM